MSKKRKYILFIFLTIILICAFYKGIKIRTYTLETDKLRSSISIVLIADLHSTIYGKDQKPLLQKIKQQKPDLILLAGDIADDVVPIDGTRLLLGGIQHIAPIYYVTGNHEYWSNDVEAICSEIQSYGVTILSDSYEEIIIKENRLVISGVNDPNKKRFEAPDYDQTEAMGEAFEDLDKTEGYKILAAHRPERIEQYAIYPFDLVVSGHTHGGQVRIPFILNGLYAPDQGWFPKYAGGLYKHGSMSHVVSRGLSINPRLPRVFNPPEIVVIRIEPPKNRPLG